MKKESSTVKLRRTTGQAEVTTTVRKSVLSGAFTSIAASSAEWGTPPFKLIPFISSTFTDTGHERDLLQNLLFELRAASKKEGEYNSIGRALQPLALIISPNAYILKQIFKSYL